MINSTKILFPEQDDGPLFFSFLLSILIHVFIIILFPYLPTPEKKPPLKIKISVLPTQFHSIKQFKKKSKKKENFTPKAPKKIAKKPVTQKKIPLKPITKKSRKPVKSVSKPNPNEPTPFSKDILSVLQTPQNKSFTPIEIKPKKSIVPFRPLKSGQDKTIPIKSAHLQKKEILRPRTKKTPISLFESLHGNVPLLTPNRTFRRQNSKRSVHSMIDTGISIIAHPKININGLESAEKIIARVEQKNLAKIELKEKKEQSQFEDPNSKVITKKNEESRAFPLPTKIEDIGPHQFDTPLPPVPNVIPWSPKKHNENRMALSQPDPSIPKWVEEQGLSLTVSFWALISPDGNVIQIVNKSRSGYAEIDVSALKATKRWHFEPIQGEKNEWVTIEFNIGPQKSK